MWVLVIQGDCGVAVCNPPTGSILATKVIGPFRTELGAMQHCDKFYSGLTSEDNVIQATVMFADSPEELTVN
jgi:hypothetical protein